MLVGSLVVAPDRGEPFGQTALDDMIGDLAAGLCRTVNVEGLAERDGGEHRRDGRCRGFDGVVGLLPVARRRRCQRGWIGQRRQQLYPVDPPGKDERGAERVGLRDADVRGVLDKEDALLGFRQFGGPLFDGCDVVDVSQVCADDHGERYLRQLGFRIEPLARDGEIPLENRANAGQFFGGIGQHVHECACRVRLSPAIAAYDGAGDSSRILHGRPGLCWSSMSLMNFRAYLF